MKKLLFVISQLYKGGAETSLVNLLNNIDYKMYSVDLIVLNQVPVDNSVSLINKVNKNVHLCDAYNEYTKINIIDRVRARVLYTKEQKGAYLFPALDLVRKKVYDWAFFVGEWASPSFVAYEVNAKIKAAWIHTDLSKAKNFDPEHYFYFMDQFDYFIFASKKSLEQSIQKYPFMEDKSVFIYNISDVNTIKEKMNETVKDIVYTKGTVNLLTVANLRNEKNHLRQVEVLAELKRRGININWYNIGATSDKVLVNKVKELCKATGVEDSFHIMGPRENPYAYMKNMDAITVLSDYESWSMVITEAKIIGVPVIATKTAGALEQIIHRQTGVLTDFSVESIADEIEEFIKDKNLRNKIKDNICNFDNTQEILSSFNELMINGKSYYERRLEKNNEKILYVIDDINYCGGAHISTKLQINDLIHSGKNISVYSNFVPSLNIRKELIGVRFLSHREFKEDIILNKRVSNLLTNPLFTKNDVKFKCNIIKEIRFKKNMNFYDEIILPHITQLFSSFDIVCVMSESSVFRKYVSESTAKKKIQWIHTDYCEWIERSDWARKITEKDSIILPKFDYIVVLTENIKDKLLSRYPEIGSKIIVNANLMPVNQIIRKANINSKGTNVSFVSVGRLDALKGWYRLLKVLYELKGEGYQFQWSIIGGGPEFENLQNKVCEYGLVDNVNFKGQLENPFSEMVKADVFALLSEYEGLPNTIYEALILGIPVLATDVGGVSTQISNGKTGWLVNNEENSIYQGIKYILENSNKINEVRLNLKEYHYDNEKINEVNKRLFSLLNNSN